MSLFRSIQNKIYALLAIILLITSTTLVFIPILLLGLLKLIPNERWKTLCTKMIDKVASLWCSINNFYINNVRKLKMDITGLDNLSLKNWYLVIANHQSWLDIIILQRLFNRQIPLLKFFIKDQLKWIPLLGFAWWAMGFPFMKRYSKEYLAKKPHKKGKDLLATQKAVATFKRTPASIMNFIEGTRFTLSKKEQQQSPYDNLLKPKAGGIGFIISSMANQITSLLDVSLVYTDKNHSLWDFLCGQVHRVKVLIRQIPIPPQFISDELLQCVQRQNEFKEWLNEQWATKDKCISSLKTL